MSLEKFFDARRKTITLDGGVEAVVRVIDAREAFLAAKALAGVDRLESEHALVAEREIVRRALVSLGGEADPIGRGLIALEDLTSSDREKIVQVVTDKFPTRGEPAGEDNVPLAPTGSPEG